MTAIVIIRQSTRICVLTDGAVYKSDGTLIGRSPKAVPLPHLNAVIAVRGSLAAFSLVVGWIAMTVLEFDEIQSKIPEILSLMAADVSLRGPVEVVVAGWSGATAKSYIMVNHENHPGVPALVAVDTGPIAIIPGDASVTAALQPCLPKDFQSPDQLDPDSFGLKILESQRLIMASVPGQMHSESAHIVGSFAQITNVYQERTETRILKVWPDPIGEKIVPSPKQ